MIETAVAYVGAYLARKSLGLLSRAGSDVDAVINKKLNQLYDWVKSKITGRPTSEASLRVLEATPQGKDQQALVSEQLAQALANDGEATRELEALVKELDRARPPGITIRGLARGDDIRGEQVGADVEGSLPAGAKIIGDAIAKTVHPGGKNIGARVRLPSPGASPPPHRKGDDA